MAVEDGAILGLLLARLQSASTANTRAEKNNQFTKLFQFYQDLRKKRTEINVAGAVQTRHYYHLPDGNEQILRDQELRALSESNWKGKCSFNWGDADIQKSLLGFDVFTEADEKFDKWWASQSLGI